MVKTLSFINLSFNSASHERLVKTSTICHPGKPEFQQAWVFLEFIAFHVGVKVASTMSADKFE
jgi:hypothetical protein